MGACHVAETGVLDGATRRRQHVGDVDQHVLPRGGEALATARLHAHARPCGRGSQRSRRLRVVVATRDRASRDWRSCSAGRAWRPGTRLHPRRDHWPGHRCRPSKSTSNGRAIGSWSRCWLPRKSAESTTHVDPPTWTNSGSGLPTIQGESMLAVWSSLGACAPGCCATQTDHVATHVHRDQARVAPGVAAVEARIGHVLDVGSSADASFGLIL